MEIVAFSRQGRLVQGWFFRFACGRKRILLAESRTDERSRPRVLAMEIWRECCWLPFSSPSAVSTTRPAPWCPRRRPITKNSPVLLPGWASRILRPFKVSYTSSSSRERADLTDLGDVVLLRLFGPLAVWVGWLSRLAPVLFLAVREFCRICICSAACIKRCAHSLSTSPFMILTRLEEATQ